MLLMLFFNKICSSFELPKMVQKEAATLNKFKVVEGFDDFDEISKIRFDKKERTFQIFDLSSLLTSVLVHRVLNQSWS